MKVKDELWLIEILAAGDWCTVHDEMLPCWSAADAKALARWWRQRYKHRYRVVRYKRVAPRSAK